MCMIQSFWCEKTVVVNFIQKQNCTTETIELHEHKKAYVHALKLT